MKLKGTLPALLAAVGVVAGSIAFAPLALASSSGAPGCPDKNVCLYEDGDFQGSMLTFPADGNGNVNESTLNQQQLKFKDGKIANDQTSSIGNNTDKPVDFLPSEGFQGQGFQLPAGKSFGSLRQARAVDKGDINDQISSFHTSPNAA